MGKIVGIDLGTTNSVIAIVDGPTPRVLDNREARAHTRSVVGLKKRRGGQGKPEQTEVLVGDAAMDNFQMAHQDTIISIKRLMGRGIGDPEVQRVRQTAPYRIVEPANGTSDSLRVVMGGKEYSAIEISAMILRKLKDDAEFRLGEPVTHAVITVPAYFTQIQRDATRKAGLGAGLTITKILEEPTAAAIAFGVETGDSTPKTALVFDLGGGTFDISVLMWAASTFAPLNLEGDMWLGGDNFDRLLVDHAVGHVRREFGMDPTGNGRFMAELTKAAQAVKERLSSANSADLLVPGILHDDAGNLIDLDMEITREEFEGMILPLVGRFRRCHCGQANHAKDPSCAACRQPLTGPVEEGKTLQLVRKALQHPNVNMTPEQIDFVIMAGNATSIPLVQTTIEEMFGTEKILRRMHPKHCVAIGAAIVAAWQGAQAMCQAPDPEDPTRECGHINADDARVCGRCGAAMERPSQEGAKAPVNAKVAAGQICGIAPVYYGAQTHGDRFNVFVAKGDAFPTAEPIAQVFRTRMPKQRMISIPIYGGDNLDRASANEFQCGAFAVLPPDLPKGTPVRVKIWLNVEGIFGISAHLDDGTDLKPWQVHGEQDAKVIKGIEKVEGLVAAGGQTVGGELGEARRAVYDRLQAHQFEAAQREVERAERAAAALGGSAPTVSLKAKAENLIRWGDFVLQQYRLGPRSRLRAADERPAERCAGRLEGRRRPAARRPLHRLRRGGRPAARSGLHLPRHPQRHRDAHRRDRSGAGRRPAPPARAGRAGRAPQHAGRRRRPARPHRTGQPGGAPAGGRQGPALFVGSRDPERPARLPDLRRGLVGARVGRRRRSPHRPHRLTWTARSARIGGCRTKRTRVRPAAPTSARSTASARSRAAGPPRRRRRCAPPCRGGSSPAPSAWACSSPPS